MSTSTHNTSALGDFVKAQRTALGLTQPELANKAGVGLRFLRELEADKPTLQMHKVNQVLAMFGYALGAQPLNRTTLFNENS